MLREDSRSIYSIKFNGNGSRLLAASDDGQIREWDLVTLAPIKRYNASLRKASDIMYALGLEYVNDYKNIAVAYNNMYVAGGNRDTVAFFNYSDPLPILKTGVSWNFKTKEMKADPKGR